MKNLLILLIAACFLVSCETLTVVSDYDKTVNFAYYKSLEYYGWAKNSDQLLNRFDKERIESAFADEFGKRGVKVVKKGKGDMIVTLYIVTEKKTQRVANTTHMGSTAVRGSMGGYYNYGPGWGWGGGMSTSTTTFNDYNYTVGTLVVSVYDAAKKKLIWEASGSGTIDENPRNRVEAIPKVVAKIMSEYPVQPGS